MTDADRARLRKLQDRWLVLQEVKYQTAAFGWSERITGNPTAPTYADVRDTLLPAWEHWFADFFRED